MENTLWLFSVGEGINLQHYDGILAQEVECFKRSPPTLEIPPRGFHCLQRISEVKNQEQAHLVTGKQPF